MKRESTEHRQVVIAAMLAVAATLMIMMLTAQNAHASAKATTLGVGSKLAHCGMLPAGAATNDYTARERNVRIIQRKLTQLGYDVGTPGVDGRYGKFTKGATASFQGDYSLKQDTKIGRETAIMLAYASHPSANVRRCKPKNMAAAH